MDLETENRIAAILMKEAAELRRQADKEGIHVYLREPNVRGRPNLRFLTTTVPGVQQVAIYGVGRLLLLYPSPKRAWLGARLILDASSIIFPIIEAEGVNKMFFNFQGK